MHKKHKNITKQKHKYANKRTKIKNMLEKHLRGKRPLIRLFAYLCLRRKKKQKSLYNENVGLTKLIKVLSALYEQKLVYQNPVKKLNYLNDSGATKLVKTIQFFNQFRLDNLVF